MEARLDTKSMKNRGWVADSIMERFGSVFSHLRAFFFADPQMGFCVQEPYSQGHRISVYLFCILYSPILARAPGGGLGAQIKRQYRGKIRIKPPYKYTSIWGSPYPKSPIRNYRSTGSPGHAPVIDVNHIRSEPGSTRLSQDDGSIHKANSLKI